MNGPKQNPVSKTARASQLEPQNVSPAVPRSKTQLKPLGNAPAGNETDGFAGLLEQYGCGPIQFAGSANASYDRHLLFDNVIPPEAAGPRERFESFARSVRDVLSQRWVLTEATYASKNPKRVYYLS